MTKNQVTITFDMGAETYAQFVAMLNRNDGRVQITGEHAPLGGEVFTFPVEQISHTTVPSDRMIYL